MCLCEGWRLRCAMCVGVVLCKGFEGLFDCACLVAVCISCVFVRIASVCILCMLVRTLHGLLLFVCIYLFV